MDQDKPPVPVAFTASLRIDQFVPNGDRLQSTTLAQVELRGATANEVVRSMLGHVQLLAESAQSALVRYADAMGRLGIPAMDLDPS